MRKVQQTVNCSLPLLMVRHFKHYLVARQLVAGTDYQALAWLETVEVDRSVVRWYEKLQQYNFTVQHRKEKGTMHRERTTL